MTIVDWDSVLAGHLAEDQCRCLAQARVGIAGAGGLGSNCAVALARTGIGHLILADHDVVAPSNLNRQFFFPRHLGQPKVKALAEELLELRPDLDVQVVQEQLDAEAARRLFAACPVVVEAVDDPIIKRMLVETLLAAGHTVVSASGMAGWGGEPMTARRLGRLVVVGDHRRAVGAGAPPLAPRVLMAAAMQADAVLEILLGPFSEPARG